MSYEKFYPNGWQSGPTGGTPITPEALNHMEQGIADAAPGGFGLGDQPKNAVSINAYVLPQFFGTTSYTTGTGEGFSTVHGAGLVRTYANAGEVVGIVQNLFGCGSGLERIRYSDDGGTTWIEEYVNPPMSNGVEYRTIERQGTKPVYAKRVVKTGIATASGSSGVTDPPPSTINVAHGISNFGSLVRAVGKIGNYPLPYLSTKGGLTAVCDCNSTNMVVRTQSEWSNTTLTVDLYYTKA